MQDYINITGKLLIVSMSILALVGWIVAALAAFFLGMAIAETIIASPKIDPEGLQASYLRASLGVLGFIGSIVVIVYALSRAGVSLVPFLTGLGIGGLALGLAARPTLGNIIASFMIFADNPYRAGQRVRVMGHDGSVESIGLRSTRIKRIDGHVVSIPNEKMAEADIENIALRPFIRRDFDITITYDTPPDRINRAVEILHEILSVPDQDSNDMRSEMDKEVIENEGSKQPSHPNEAINKPDYPPRVYFNELNADSLNIRVIYWFFPPEWWDYLEHCHRINVQILERFNAEGIEFAFPTQTLHIEGA
jgi:MscS family membrane protein